VKPIALDFGAFKIHWYGVLVAVGFLLGIWTASRRALRVGIAAEKIIELGPWLLIGAILGARAFYVLSYWQVEFAGKPIINIFKVRTGLVYYGGLIGASLATIIKAVLSKMPLWKLADILAPSIALGHAIGRLGCLMTGCCYGRACDLPWAIRFPEGHETHPLDKPATPVHPTQIYESLLNLALYGALAWLFRRKKFDGQVFAIYLVSYAVLRSFVELFRGDYLVRYLGGIATPAQLVSIGIFLVGLFLLWQLPRPEQKAKTEDGG
jgi:phosphatidylglycerol:prolipoprotein diacylglycerol transferase